MKKKLFIITVFVIAVSVWSCSGVKRDPGRVYMPDMAYSRAYETYADDSFLLQEGIHYNAIPVSGTIKRNELMPFPLAEDKPGDTTNYVAAKKIVSPIINLDARDMTEARRLYLVNCGICHGSKLDGNGPLYNGGNGPFPAAPRNLLDDYAKKMPDGQMFYSVTYGKNMMGSYASQLNTRQRWMVIHYIKTEQAKSEGGSATADSTATAKK